ncbi:MAG: ATP-binding cassette domain-containing protein [Bacteroidales bacterium]|nr:ATP-binding cassette domain-containing protein [Bacteroidales bacterium]
MSCHVESKEPVLISLCEVSMVRDRRIILSDVNFKVHRGDFVAITGPNGGGKTTLLRIILGLLHPTAGSVWVEPKLSIGYLPQKNMIDSHFPISVREVVESGLLAERGLSREMRRKRVEDALSKVEMADFGHRPIGELSGGQLQRALLGRAIISEPKLLVLDEPLSYIDKRFESRLYGLIADIARHTTILLVSHEMSTISTMANRHLIIDHALHECSAEHHYIKTDCD